jgi:ABC-type uncharacterized transport system auxiliary subunit
MALRLTISRAVLAVALALGAGCIHGKLPPIEYYRLRLPAAEDTLAPSIDRDGGVVGAAVLPPGAVAILPYAAPGIYGDGGIVYRIDESAYGAYPNREWAVSVPTMLGMLTQDLFLLRPLTRDPSVFDPPSAHAYAYVWRGLVRELEEVDRGKQVFAAVRLDARLVRARDDSVLWSGTARLERPVPEGTMPAIVAALSTLTEQVILQLQDSARVALGGSRPSTVAAPPR